MGTGGSPHGCPLWLPPHGPLTAVVVAMHIKMRKLARHTYARGSATVGEGTTTADKPSCALPSPSCRESARNIKRINDMIGRELILKKENSINAWV